MESAKSDAAYQETLRQEIDEAAGHIFRRVHFHLSRAQGNTVDPESGSCTRNLDAFRTGITYEGTVIMMTASGLYSTSPREDRPATAHSTIDLVVMGCRSDSGRLYSQPNLTIARDLAFSGTPEEFEVAKTDLNQGNYSARVESTQGEWDLKIQLGYLRSIEDALNQDY